MAQASNQELTDRFIQFYRNYYRDEIGKLAQQYPNEKRSLYIDYDDLYQFDTDLAEDYLSQPEQLQEYAEEALRLYDLPADVKLGNAHVRLQNLPESVDIRGIRVHDNHIGKLISVQGIVRKATDVRPKITDSAFECQRCGTMNYIPQTDGGFQEPHECQGCERQGPFRINFDQSEFIDAQKIRVQESPEGLRGGETPQSIDINVEDDITGKVTPGDHVTVVGVLHIDQMSEGNEKSSLFDLYMDGTAITVEDEEFENMDIEEADIERIVELSAEADIYDRMVGSVAPTIYGYEEEKLAMILQLFSGVTKNLPDGSRIRGDLHMLLIGDPGTGKCQKFDTNVVLGDGTERQLGDLVESNLDDPIPVDDGVYQPVEFPVQSVTPDGRITVEQATKVWKREAPEQMYRIKTKSGREVEVTPSHPLFVQNGLWMDTRTAENLNEGEFIALPQRLQSEGDDTLDIDHRRVENGPANRIDTPETLTPELARLLGYQIGEGHVSGNKSSGSAVITNADDTILTDVAACLDSLGLHWWRRPHHDRDNVEIVGCSSAEFIDFLNEIEPAILERSAEQRVPECLFRASQPIKREFLKAYIEGESHVSRTQREIAVASMSRELLEGVHSLLLGFGIESSIEARQNGSYRLRISGSDFISCVTEIGFVTERKQAASTAFADVAENTNTDIIPNVSETLRHIRDALGLSQFDCGVPRTTYQHYERGDRNPSRENLQTVLLKFRARLEWLTDVQQRLDEGDWSEIEHVRRELNISQEELAEGTDVSQGSISNYERNTVTPDGGVTRDARNTIQDRISEAMAVAEEVQALQQLVDSDVSWDRIDSIEQVTPDYDWVYDLEVSGTHTYLGNGVVSHNSQMLSYIENIAPRSVYTSGKGSSSAGLCVTGDTLVHTDEGFRQINELVTSELPEPVSDETAVEKEVGLQTFDRETGEMKSDTSSHAWRMPEKECRRLETAHGKELEASRSTPVLTCGSDGMEWIEISAVEPGEYVAVPRYADLDRSEIDVREFLELTTEKVRLADETVAFLREELTVEFGSLRDAAAALDLSENFIYLHLKNRHVPLDKLDRMLDAVGATREDASIERAMLRHGDSITIPETFDEDLMYLLGLVFGDGDISLNRRDGNRGMVRISNSDTQLLERAADIFETKFDKRPDIERQADKVPCIRANSATIARLFANAGMQTPKDGLALDPRLTTAAHADAFLRGLMDADGSVSARNDGGSSVLMSTISDDLAEQVQLMLETYGVRAQTRERDRRGTYELADGQTIESKHIQQHLEIYGADIDRYAENIGFASAAKAEALQEIISTERRQRETMPVGSALATAEGSAGEYYMNVHRGDNPGRARARSMLQDTDLGPAEPLVREVVDAELRWDEVVAVENTGEKEVFDLTVPETHNFVGNGLVTHNTAAAVQDDFGDGQQWTLEAGALVLADKGIAAVDELDKMASDDRSAMHEALEQQKISISKAGINATLKSRCSLLGAANPKYGRFDQYEPIGEQIDLEPALISRFDLIFTVTDQPDPEKDGKLADHILTTNYAGELNTQRDRIATSEFTKQEVEEVTEEVAPEIDAELLRKYIAHAKRSCYPTMTDEAKATIREFYVDLRSKGADEDAPIPVTARKLEALVRLAEASARVRLSDTVEPEDAERSVEIVRSCLQDIGVDPETGQFDADVVETGTSKTQRDRIKNIKNLISEIEAEFEEGAPIEEVLDRADEVGMDATKAEGEIEKLRRKGEVYEPKQDHLRTT